MNHKTIYMRTPVNRQAAIVTNQKNCRGTQITPEQERANLVKKLNALKAELPNYSKKSWHRKNIGIEIQKLQDKIHNIRPSLKAPNADRFFIEAAKELLTKSMFSLILHKASIKSEEYSVDFTEDRRRNEKLYRL